MMKEKNIVYLTADEILTIHYTIMEVYGAGEQAGIFFQDRFEAAVERPKAHFFGQEVHQTLWEKAGAFVQSLIQEHPFHNGNNRTALTCLIVFLEANGYEFTMSNKDAEDFMVEITIGDKFKGEEIPKIIGEIISKNVVLIH
jgi:death on curing protein